MDGSGDLPLWDFRYPTQGAIAFEILRVEVPPARATFAPKPERADAYEILWVDSGSGTHAIDFRDYPIGANTLFCLTPGQVHAAHIQAPVRGARMRFQADTVSGGRVAQGFLRSLDFFHRIDLDPVIALDEEEAQPLLALLRDLMLEVAQEGFGRALAIQARLRLFLIQLQRLCLEARRMGPPTAAQVWLDEYQRLIDQHYQAKRNVQDYAALLGISPGHLTNICTELVGQPAGALLRNRILLEAKRLLAHTERTAAEIGAELHFEDPSYFGRFFRRETGQSPLAFRHEFRQAFLAGR